MTYNEMAKLVPVNKNCRDDRIEAMQLQMDTLKNFHKYEMDNLKVWKSLWKSIACANLVIIVALFLMLVL